MVWKIKSRYLASNPSAIHTWVQALDSDTFWCSSCAEIFIFQLKLMEKCSFYQAVKLCAGHITSASSYQSNRCGCPQPFVEFLTKLMKSYEGRKKKTLKNWKEEQTVFQKEHIFCKLIMSAQHRSWPTYISHRYVCAFKPGIETWL